jgi:hypothetical protein
MAKHIATATIEEGKEENRVKRWIDEVEDIFNVMGIRKQDGSDQRPSVMEEDCTGSLGTQRTATLGKEKKKY